MTGTLLFYEYRFSDRDTMRWWGYSNRAFCKRICLNILHSQVAGMQKLLVRVLTSEPPGETFTNYFSS